MPGYVDNQRLQAGTHHTPDRRHPAAQGATENALPPGAAQAAPPGASLDIPLAELPAHLGGAGGRRVEGPEDFNAYEVKRVDQADKAVRLAKIAIGATVTVGVGGLVIGGLNLGSHSGNPTPPPATPYVSPNP